MCLHPTYLLAHRVLDPGASLAVNAFERARLLTQSSEVGCVLGLDFGFDGEKLGGLQKECSRRELDGLKRTRLT